MLFERCINAITGPPKKKAKKLQFDTSGSQQSADDVDVGKVPAKMKKKAPNQGGNAGYRPRNSNDYSLKLHDHMFSNVGPLSARKGRNIQQICYIC